jgi:radical SAM-linked protein
MRLVVKYARDGAAKYISHLDMQRAFGRAVRRANLEARYSQGFNPHIRMSFASPLSVGYATVADYLEVAIERADARAARDALNAVLPGDIRVVDAFVLPDGGRKLMSISDSAAYRIGFTLENEQGCDTMNCAVQKLRAAKQCVARDRRGREVDIARFVIRMDFRNCVLDAVLRNSSAGALNPAVLAEAVRAEAGAGTGYEICRTECYARVDGEVLSFSDWAARQ